MITYDKFQIRTSALKNNSILNYYSVTMASIRNLHSACLATYNVKRRIPRNPYREARTHKIG